MTCAELQAQKDVQSALSAALTTIIQADFALEQAQQVVIQGQQAILTGLTQQRQTDQMRKSAADGMVTQITQQMQMQSCN